MGVSEELRLLLLSIAQQERGEDTNRWSGRQPSSNINL